jgi:hypothetical protein
VNRSVSFRASTKIESSLIPRAFALLSFLTIVDGCAHARRPLGNANANASSVAQANVPLDVAVSKLPRARFPAAPMGAAPMAIPSDEKVLGIYTDQIDGTPRVTGIKDRGRALAALSATPDDPPEESYCVLTASAPAARFGSGRGPRSGPAGKEKIFQPGLLGYHAQASTEERIHAERVDGQTLSVITAWQAGGVRQVGRGTIPMRSIGAMGGVEVLAFVDQDPTSPAVNLVVTRPPVKKGRVHGSAFIASLPDGTTAGASCRHARFAFPLERGNGGSATLIVAVETEKGVRPMRVNMSSLWLQSEADARVTARFDWDGPESDLFPDAARERAMRDRPSTRRRSGGGDDF